MNLALFLPIHFNQRILKPMKAFLTRPTFNTPMLKEKLLSAGIELEVRDNPDICPQEILLKKSLEVDALLTHTEDTIDQALLDYAQQSNRLKMIANMGIGFSNIDTLCAKKYNIAVTNTPTEDAFEATAEATVALLLSIARRIPALHMERNNLSEDPAPSFARPTAVSVRHKTTGIIGMGRIGSRVAKTMHHGFNNQIIYYDICAKPDLDNYIHSKLVNLPYLMANSDFICVNMPLHCDTKNLINAEMISLMKNHATFINTSRAELVDEHALIARLNAGRLHGAGLDVYGNQVNNITEDNIALTSHFANFEDQAYNAMTDLVAKNVISVLKNNTPLTSAY